MYMIWWLDLKGVVMLFFEKAQSCSPSGFTLMYGLAGLAILIAGLGVYVWFRFIKSKAVILNSLGAKVGASASCSVPDMTFVP